MPSVGFEDYYREVFGARWPLLRTALCGPAPQVNLRQIYPELGGDYWLDPASLLLSRLLPLEGSQIWDMCAAPGGKMLGLALRQKQLDRFPNCQLLATERSSARFQRLKQQHQLLPEPQNVRLQRADACRLAQHYKKTGQQFDSILLDAPCSSERHLLKNPKLLNQWNRSRSLRNSCLQMALLCSGLDCLAPSGYLLYTTCAVSPLENAQVVHKALQKRTSLGIQAVPLNQETCPGWNLEPTWPEPKNQKEKPLGYNILPDCQSQYAGCGPFYFCLLHRALTKNTQ